MKAILFFILCFTIKSHANEVKYSEALDVLLVLDSISGVDRSVDFSKEFKGEELESLNSHFDDYRQMRNRLKRRQELNSPVWGNLVVERDLLMPIFADAKSVDDALKRSVGLFQKDEKKQLEAFLMKAKPIITPLVSQSFAHQKMIAHVKKIFNKDQFFKKIDNAIKLFQLQSDKRQKITIFLSYQSVESEPSVKALGPYTILRIHPSKLKDFDNFNEILFQIFQFYPGYLSPSAQQNLELAFKDRCKFPESLNRSEMLLRPLAWALAQIDPRGKLVPISSNNSISPWLEVYSQLLIPALMQDIKEKRNIFTGQWIPRAVKSCDEILLLTNFMSSLR